MSTIIDQKPQAQANFNGMPYDARFQQGPQQQSPQFTNPWGAPSGNAQYPSSIPANNGAPPMQPQQSQQQLPQQPQPGHYSRPGSISIANAAMGYPLPQSTSSNHSSFSAEVPPTQQRSSYPQPGFPASQTAYPQYPQPNAQHRYSHDYTNMSSNYAQSEAARRASYPVKPSYNRSDESFNEQLAAGRNMLALNQASSDITPRNIYGPRNGSIDSYGFPPQYSNHSSMSSASGASSFPYYSSHNPSIDGSIASSSITDYSSETENLANRTLPVPGQLMGTPAFPPEPASMMTQFNSKLAGATQKKHKCKICDKRFTRPSSLQTHMYSHTGEKPFACDFAGCGRHFSVVSNLRRHKKCHRAGNEGRAASGDEE